jgi:solute carrier family 25 (mitochondrial citrate transporter), member 1
VCIHLTSSIEKMNFLFSNSNPLLQNLLESKRSPSTIVIAYAPMSGGSGKKRNPYKAVVAGGIAGAVEACISYPTEYIKTNLQLFEDKAKMGPIQCARETIKKDGVFGLYNGLSSLLFFSVPKVASRFLAFEGLKSYIADEKGNMTAAQTLLCGLGAGTTEAIIAVTPMDTIKTRLIHDQLTRTPSERRYKGFFHGVREIVKEQGLGGIYKGLTATILKQSTNQAIRWLTFSKAKEAMASNLTNGDVSKLHTGHTIFASVLAGAASVYGNTPIDVVKTRMQGLQAERYKSTLDCAVQIMKNEGPRAFYKGATARLARVCLDVTVIMVLYEQINHVLDSVWKTE